MTHLTDALAELRAQLHPDKLTTNSSVLQSHGRDENFPEVRPPLAVAYAEQASLPQHACMWDWEGVLTIYTGCATLSIITLSPAQNCFSGGAAYLHATCTFLNGSASFMPNCCYLHVEG